MTKKNLYRIRLGPLGKESRLYKVDGTLLMRFFSKNLNVKSLLTKEVDHSYYLFLIKKNFISFFN